MRPATRCRSSIRGQRRLRRLLGVVVRALPQVVSVDERDAAEIRRAGFAVVAVNVDKSRADAERFLHAMPAQFTMVFDASGRDARCLRRQGDAELVRSIDATGNVALVEAGFRDENAAPSSKAGSALLVGTQ